VREAERIRAAYVRREERGLEGRYSYWEPANLYLYQGRERALVSLLADAGLLPMTNLRVLDVGCGEGAVLRDLLRFGARPENLVGVDLLVSRLARAGALNPGMAFSVADAAELPYLNASFDLLLAFTLLSSIVDVEARVAAASEMLRVLRPGGVLVAYDFWVNPRNPDVRPLSRAEVRRLFPECTFNWRRVTLAPPLLRLLAPRAPGGWLACYLLEKLPFLCTHFLVSVTKGHA
jgi:ubiquinone/menaquinone biosynthesis C-methylase UbiE